MYSLSKPPQALMKGIGGLFGGIADMQQQSEMYKLQGRMLSPPYYVGADPYYTQTIDMLRREITELQAKNERLEAQIDRLLKRLVEYQKRTPLQQYSGGPNG